MQPSVFIGHGSPMNAIQATEFSRGWVNWGKKMYPESSFLPKAILVVSAHWLTEGTKLTANSHPKTIHDFRGFPQELFQVEYPAPGDPSLSHKWANEFRFTDLEEDHSWGLDHGTWSFLRWIFPEANIPVLQLSIDYKKPFYWHYELAKELSRLREENVLVVGSGNLVHNLSLYNWRNPNEKLEWAQEASETFHKLILSGDAGKLSEGSQISTAAKLAINSAEHFVPILYSMGFSREKEEPYFFNDVVQSALSMTSISWGEATPASDKQELFESIGK
jgi:4,5-DOPA dioxygenase extradiol